MSLVTVQARTVDLRVLGPLEVRAAEAVVPLGPRKQQTVLAVLTMRAGQVVGLSELIDELWPDSPPASAVANVRSYAASLRRTFESVEGRRDRLVRSGSGYQLNAGPHQVDLLAFSAGCAAGRQARAGGHLTGAATHFADALTYWRGPILSGLPQGPSLAARSAVVTEERMAITEELAEVYLALAQPGEVVGLLHPHVQMHPLRERASGLLMRALYRVGDIAGALSVYASTRDALVEQLGIEPGPELQDLHYSILRRDSGLSSRRTGASAATESISNDTNQHRHAAAAAPNPAELPADLADFVGRAAQTERVLAVLGGSGAGSVPICAVVGQPGVGKTTLAVHVAHRLKATYPDGQLFVDLRGADRHPLAPSEVLARFLRALGLPGHAIPRELEERAALYRSLLAGRRLLVVLDNAAGEEQVSPLLPGADSCAVLVTSRHRLAGLAGFSSIALTEFSTDSALRLLDRTVGETRISAEPDAARDLVRLCGGLPLALRVVASKLATAPHRGLAALVERLAEERHRLDHLAHAGLAVRSSLDFSYQRLSSDDRLVLRRAALLDAPDFPAWTAAVAADQPQPPVEDALDRLIAANLVQAIGTDVAGQVRYHMHDLIRLYARERAEVEEPEADRREAVRRVLHYWLSLASTGEEALYGPSYLAGVGRELAAVTVDAADRRRVSAAPLTWIEAERTALVAAVQQAAELDMFAECWRLAAVSLRMLDHREFLDDARSTHKTALHAARQLNDRRGEAVARTGLGKIDAAQGDWVRSRATLEAVEQAFLDLRDERGVAHCYRELAYLDRYQGRFGSACKRYARIVELSRGVDPAMESLGLRGIGQTYLFAGEPRKALVILEAALEMSGSEAGLVPRQFVLVWYGAAHLQLGDTARACAAFQEVLAWSRQAGDPVGETLALTSLAEAALQDGDLEMAEQHAARAAEVFSPSRETHFVRPTTNEVLARVCLARGAIARARVHVERVLAVGRTLGKVVYEIRALDLLADIHQATGDAEAAAGAKAEADALRQTLEPV